MKKLKHKVKFLKDFNGETGSVFTINYETLRCIIEDSNDFLVEGFTITEKGIDVFINRAVSVDNVIKIKGQI